MATEIKVKVFTQGGDEHEIQVPLDMRAADFIKDLAIALSLPVTDAEGHQVSWRMDNKDTGRTLESDRTLEENGVSDGHRLSLIRAVTAGSCEKM